MQQLPIPVGARHNGRCMYGVHILPHVQKRVYSVRRTASKSWGYMPAEEEGGRERGSLTYDSHNHAPQPHLGLSPPANKQGEAIPALLHTLPGVCVVTQGPDLDLSVLHCVPRQDRVVVCTV